MSLPRLTQVMADGHVSFLIGNVEYTYEIDLAIFNTLSQTFGWKLLNAVKTKGKLVDKKEVRYVSR